MNLESDSDSSVVFHRREVLRRLTCLLGGAISGPAALAVLHGCSAKDARQTWKPKFFVGSETQVISAIADIIIPKTDTSGALDANVPAFIDCVLADVYAAEAQQRFHSGCAEFAAVAGAHGKTFLEQDRSAQTSTVKQALQAALASERRQQQPFILTARELVLLGFYTSQVGITENMQYEAVPNFYRGRVPIAQMEKPVYWE